MSKLIGPLRSLLILALGLGLVTACGPRRGDDDELADDDDSASSDDDDATADDDDASADDDDTTAADDDDATTDDDDATPPDPWVATEFMYAHTSSTLYSVAPEAPYTVTEVAGFWRSDGDSMPSLTDLAVSIQGQMYGVSTNGLWHVAATTGEAELVFESTGEFLVAATFLSDGTLLIGGDTNLYVADVAAGTYQVVSAFEGWEWDGDMVGLPDGLLYCAVRAGDDEPATLLVYDYVSESEVWDAPTGAGSLFGIAYAEGVLFGFTDGGDILEIDGVTGAATVVSSPGHGFYGATTNPVRWSDL